MQNIMEAPTIYKGIYIDIIYGGNGIITSFSDVLFFCFGLLVLVLVILFCVLVRLKVTIKVFFSLY